MHPKGMNLQASGAFGGEAAGTTQHGNNPSKKDKQKESRLPELTINKSKINFAVKQPKNAEEPRASNRQQREQAQGNTGNPAPVGGQPANARNAAQGQKGKRKKPKKEYNQAGPAEHSLQERPEKAERERMPGSPAKRHPIDDMSQLMASTATRKMLTKHRSPSR